MVDSILNFIQLHATWAVMFIFMIAFLESLFVIGLLIPGWLLLVGVGGLIGTNILPFYPIVISAYFGAVIGEFVSYYLGKYYHQVILNWSLAARHSRFIDRAHDFFELYGVVGVFAGRFLGPTRAILPFIAGVAEMSQRQFFWVNIISGLFWAPLYLMPGMLAGAAFELNPEQGRLLMLLLLVIGGSLFLAYKSYLQFNDNQHSRGWSLVKPIGLFSVAITSLIVLFNSSLFQYLRQIVSLLKSHL